MQTLIAKLENGVNLDQQIPDGDSRLPLSKRIEMIESISKHHHDDSPIVELHYIQKEN